MAHINHAQRLQVESEWREWCAKITALAFLTLCTVGAKSFQALCKLTFCACLACLSKKNLLSYCLACCSSGRIARYSSEGFILIWYFDEAGGEHCPTSWSKISRWAEMWWLWWFQHMILRIFPLIESLGYSWACRMEAFFFFSFFSVFAKLPRGFVVLHCLAFSRVSRESLTELTHF